MRKGSSLPADRYCGNDYDPCLLPEMQLGNENGNHCIYPFGDSFFYGTTEDLYSIQTLQLRGNADQYYGSDRRIPGSISNYTYGEGLKRVAYYIVWIISYTKSGGGIYGMST